MVFELMDLSTWFCSFLYDGNWWKTLIIENIGIMGVAQVLVGGHTGL